MAIRSFVVSLLTAATAILSTPATVSAQTDPFDNPPRPKHVDLSGSSGFLLSTDWSDLVLLGGVSPASGALEQVLVRDLTVDPGPVFDATVTYWEGRYGLRAHGGFAKSCLAVGRHCGDLGAVAQSPGKVDVRTYFYDVGGAIGLIDYGRDRWAWPYVFAGIGGVTYDLEKTIGPSLTFIERRPASGADGRPVIRDSPDELLIAVDELGIETQLALNAGLGTDFRIPLGAASLGVRVELSDHMHRSPIELAVRNLETFSRHDDTEVDFGLVHNVRVAAGVVVQFGR